MSFEEVRALVQRSRSESALQKSDSIKSLQDLYNRMGCERNAHASKNQFDSCLTAKTYLNLVAAGKAPQ